MSARHVTPRSENGFNLIEALVVVAIVLAMAGVVVPVVSMKKLDDQWRRVDDDLRSIAAGIRSYIDETRTFPTGHTGATSYHFLYTDGVRPKNNVFESGPATHVGKFLESPSMASDAWSGPYVDETIGPDPWGNAYLVNVNGFFSASERVLIVCAGPNGRLDTPPSATVAGDDDIVLLVD